MPDQRGGHAPRRPALHDVFASSPWPASDRDRGSYARRAARRRRPPPSTDWIGPGFKATGRRKRKRKKKEKEKKKDEEGKEGEKANLAIRRFTRRPVCHLLLSMSLSCLSVFSLSRHRDCSGASRSFRRVRCVLRVFACVSTQERMSAPEREAVKIQIPGRQRYPDIRDIRTPTAIRL